MSRSAKKGFYVEESLFKKVEALNAKGDQAGYQNLVQKFHNLP